MSIFAELSQLFENGSNVYAIWQQLLCATAFFFSSWLLNELPLSAI
jgi:hypothetical protein